MLKILNGFYIIIFNQNSLLVFELIKTKLYFFINDNDDKFFDDEEYCGFREYEFPFKTFYLRISL